MPELPPGPGTLPLVQMMHWVWRPIPFMEECARQYGDCFTVRFPLFGHPGDRPPLVFFSDPDAVREIFTGDEADLLAGEANAPLEALVGRHSLLLLDGAHHMHERRLMMPSFHGERMQAYGDVMRQVTDRVIDAWPLEQPFPIHPHMQGITLAVILRTVFGLDEGARMTHLRDLLTRLLATGSNPLALLPWFRVELGGLTPWGRLARVGREVDAILLDEIRRRRAAGREGREDVLSMLVEARDETGRPMSDEELRDEMMTLLAAGHETSATTLCWVFNRVLRHPEVLEKLRAELAHVVGGGPVEPRHVPQLEYLDATIKETLRLNPIIPLVGRRLRTPMRIGGRELPAGAIAAPCIYLTHRRPEAWPDPERFDPERFVGQRTSPYAFFPFGGGVRRCLGMAFALYEMKIVVAEVLTRAVLRGAPGYRVRVVRRGITFAPSDGMPVVVEAIAA
jgi:cytochrome P450